MTAQPKKTAIIAGLGPGLGHALCLTLAEAGYAVGGISRSGSIDDQLIDELGASLYHPASADLTKASEVNRAISEIEQHFGTATIYIHNAARIHYQSFPETPPDVFESLWRNQCLGAVHGAQRVLPGMLARQEGTLLFIGATGSVKAGSGFSAFASAKFALRGLTQALARELGPKGIHVAHLIIDGVILSEQAKHKYGLREDECLNPHSVARSCLSLIQQEKTAWTHEMDIRPAKETF
jgi:NAD(P)-dependent dehydrogenase (short-subunit alcohol dehydrogenase family)